jgi:hypothetical protein
MKNVLKPILLLSTILSLIFVTYGCLKEEMDSTKTKPLATNKVLYTEDFEPIKEGIENLRDGTYSPFMSPISLVRYDVFIRKLIVYNIIKVDSVVYKRISNSAHVYLGITFTPYSTQVFFNDGTFEVFQSLSPSYLGVSNTIIPNIINNQLGNSNEDQYTQITRTNRRSLQYNEYCGVNLWEWTYLIQSSSGVTLTKPIQGLCDLSLNYKLIF